MVTIDIEQLQDTVQVITLADLLNVPGLSLAENTDATLSRLNPFQWFKSGTVLLGALLFLSL